MVHRSTTYSLPSVFISESKHPSMIVKVSPPDLLEDQDWLNDQNPTLWVVFHAMKCMPITKQPGISAMLPIWRDDTESPGTIKHLLDVLTNATGYLNPGQAAVVGFDEPRYDIAKKLQWYHPDLYGPAKLVLMLGALHREMVTLGCLGDWLQDNGWT